MLALLLPQAGGSRPYGRCLCSCHAALCGRLACHTQLRSPRRLRTVPPSAAAPPSAAGRLCRMRWPLTRGWLRRDVWLPQGCMAVGCSTSCASNAASGACPTLISSCASHLRTSSASSSQCFKNISWLGRRHLLRLGSRSVECSRWTPAGRYPRDESMLAGRLM